MGWNSTQSLKPCLEKFSLTWEDICGMMLILKQKILKIKHHRFSFKMTTCKLVGILIVYKGLISIKVFFGEVYILSEKSNNDRDERRDATEVTVYDLFHFASVLLSITRLHYDFRAPWEILSFWVPSSIKKSYEKLYFTVEFV